MSAIGAGIGAAASYFGMQSQRRASRKYMDFLLNSPAYQAQAAALGYLRPRLGKGSQLLAQQYGKGVEGIQRAGDRNVRRSQAYWKASGNVGRGRGEVMRSRTATGEALNSAALQYGSSQEQYKLGNLQALAEVGRGMAPMTGAAGQGILGQENAAYQFADDFAGILSSYLGWNTPNPNLGGPIASNKNTGKVG